MDVVSVGMAVFRFVSGMDRRVARAFASGAAMLSGGMRGACCVGGRPDARDRPIGHQHPGADRGQSRPGERGGARQSAPSRQRAHHRHAGHPHRDRRGAQAFHRVGVADHREDALQQALVHPCSNTAARGTCRMRGSRNRKYTGKYSSEAMVSAAVAANGSSFQCLHSRVNNAQARPAARNIRSPIQLPGAAAPPRLCAPVSTMPSSTMAAPHSAGADGARPARARPARCPSRP